MKKLFALLTVLLLAVAMTVSASAAVTYLDDKTIPYATPTLDGVLSEGEWTAKFAMNSQNLMSVGGQTPAADFKLDTYLAWDENYLYVAYDVVSSNKGTLFFGQAGDAIRFFMDVNGLCAANGNKNCDAHFLSTQVIAVLEGQGANTVTGYGLAYNGWTGDWHPGDLTDKGNVGENGGATGTDGAWTLEYRIAWTEMDALLKLSYPDQTLPAAEAGMVITFMPSFHDVDGNYAGAGWYIGQNKGYMTKNEAGEDVEVTWAAAVPSCYGFRGTLAAPAPEQPSAPETADTLSFGILLGAVALAGTALVMGKKR